MNQTLVLKSLRMLQLYVNYHLKVHPVNLDKFHYTVTEGDIDDRITIDECSAVGFDDSNFFFTLLEDGTEVGVVICVNYVGDCEGTIYPGEVKTCTIENYITAVDLFPSPT